MFNFFKQLGYGEMFGSLIKVPGREEGSLVMAVQTVEPNTEVVKFSCNDYERITQVRKKINLFENFIFISFFLKKNKNNSK